MPRAVGSEHEDGTQGCMPGPAGSAGWCSCAGDSRAARGHHAGATAAASDAEHPAGALALCHLLVLHTAFAAQTLSLIACCATLACSLDKLVLISDVVCDLHRRASPRACRRCGTAPAPRRGRCPIPPPSRPPPPAWNTYPTRRRQNTAPVPARHPALHLASNSARSQTARSQTTPPSCGG